MKIYIDHYKRKEVYHKDKEVIIINSQLQVKLKINLNDISIYSQLIKTS